MTAQSFLLAMRLADSFLPVGTHTASYGVEQYVNDDRVGTAEQLGDLVEGYLRRIVGPTDIVALANAHAAAANADLDGVLAADRRLHAATLPAEFRDSSTTGGEKLLELLAETDGRLFAAVDSNEGRAGAGAVADGAGADVAGAYAAAVADAETPGHYAVALGVVCQQGGLSRLDVCLLYGYAFVAELLAAAQRLGRFGHTAIQAQLAALLPVIEDVCATYADADLQRLSSFAPLAEIMGMSHERADRRLFMS